MTHATEIREQTEALIAEAEKAKIEKAVAFVDKDCEISIHCAKKALRFETMLEIPTDISCQAVMSELRRNGYAVRRHNGSPTWISINW